MFSLSVKKVQIHHFSTTTKTTTIMLTGPVLHPENTKLLEESQGTCTGACIIGEYLGVVVMLIREVPYTNWLSLNISFLEIHVDVQV